MRVVVISDTHGAHERVEGMLPEGDVLVHTGDAADSPCLKERTAFVEWFGAPALAYDYKVFTAGNHDLDFTGATRAFVDRADRSVQQQPQDEAEGEGKRGEAEGTGSLVARLGTLFERGRNDAFEEWGQAFEASMAQIEGRCEGQDADAGGRQGQGKIHHLVHSGVSIRVQDGVSERNGEEKEDVHEHADSEIVLNVHGAPYHPRRNGPLPMTTQGFSADDRCHLLLSHEPPYAVLDESKTSRTSIGSRDVAELLLCKRPLVHVFGHVHEARGVRHVRHRDLRDALLCDEASVWPSEVAPSEPEPDTDSDEAVAACVLAPDKATVGLRRVGCWRSVDLDEATVCVNASCSKDGLAPYVLDFVPDDESDAEDALVIRCFEVVSSTLLCDR